jgi:YVTN family beta-propeller protein
MNTSRTRYLQCATRFLPTRLHRAIFLGLLTLVTGAVMALVAGAAQAQAGRAIDAGGFVYTADEHGNTISAIDLAAGRVTTIPIAISPHNIQVTPDGAQVLAVGEPVSDGHAHGHGATTYRAAETRGRLLVFDATALAKGPVAEIEVGAHPAHVVTDIGGRRAFVTNAGDDTVSVVDLAKMTVIGTVATGRYPHGLRVSPDGGEAYVANVQGGSLSVVDTSSLTEVARILVGATPVQVGFTPDGSRVYVSLRDENRIAVVATGSQALIGTVDVGRNPIQVHATPDGRFVYAANQGTDAEPADTVSVIDTATGSVIDTIRTGNGAHGVSVSDDGALVFVTNIVASTVSVIDAATRTVIATFTVGKGPNGVTFRATGEGQRS